MKWKIAETSYVININKPLTRASLRQSLKVKCSRMKLDWIEQLLQKFDNVRTCGFCDRIDGSYQFLYEQVGLNELKILGIEYETDLHYCRRSACEGSKLNPNSIEFVAKSRKITTDAALTLIHARNRTPFYRCNHSSDTEYAKSQNIYDGLTLEQREGVIAKQNYARSLEGYKERHGLDGERLWREVQRHKAITVENLSRLHDDAPQRIATWKSKTSCSLDNYVRRYGDTELAKELYVQHVRKITAHYGKRFEYEGYAFYSKVEARFFDMLRQHARGIIFEHDAYYPDSARRSDFYFPAINLHVELAFAFYFDGYAKRLDEKRKLFNPLIITAESDFQTAIDDIVRQHDQLKINSTS
jgi:hypothetical protein